jgi:hypothetical protein
MASLKADLTAEIDRVKGKIDQQKKLIKRNAKKNLILETAETEMKALRTHLSVLEANLANCVDPATSAA